MFGIILIKPGQVNEGRHVVQVLRLAIIFRFKFDPVEHTKPVYFWHRRH